MRALIRTLICATATVVTAVTAVAQSDVRAHVESGSGPVCNRPEQVRQLVSQIGGITDALKLVNLGHDKAVCDVLNVRYVRGTSLGAFTTQRTQGEVVRIAIVGIRIGDKWVRVAPMVAYTFLERAPAKK